VFVRDRLLGTTERVSVDAAGNEGNQISVASSISGDGRFVAFDSLASNLVPFDTNSSSTSSSSIGPQERSCVPASTRRWPGERRQRIRVRLAERRIRRLQSAAADLVANDGNLRRMTASFATSGRNDDAVQRRFERRRSE
jgi:hypothetical protein